MTAVIAEHEVDLGSGGKMTIKIKRSKCGKGVVVSQIRTINGKRSVSCSGSCDGGPTISWSCPDGTDCSLDCTSGSPVGGCS